MSADQLLSDVRAVIRAPLSPNAAKLWLHVLCEGGEISGQTRQQIGHELDLDPATITLASSELEDTGWLATERSIRPNGAPYKTYRCLYPHRKEVAL